MAAARFALICFTLFGLLQGPSSYAANLFDKRIISSISLDNGTYFLLYANGTKQTLSADEFGLYRKNESTAVKRYIESPTRENFDLLTADKKFDYAVAGLKSRLLFGDVDQNSVTKAYEYAKAQAGSHDEAALYAHLLQFSVNLNNPTSEDRLIMNRAFSHEMERAKGSLSSSSHPICLLMNRIAPQLKPNPLSSGEWQVRHFHGQWKNALDEVNRVLQERTDRANIEGIYCPGFHNSVKDYLAVETQFSDEYLASVDENGKKLSAPQWVITNNTVASPPTYAGPSWCSDDEIRNLFKPLIQQAKALPNVDHLFNLREGNGLCQIGGQRRLSESGQLIYSHQPRLGESKWPDAKFYHVKELVALIKANQGPKPKTVVQEGQKIPDALRKSPTLLPVRLPCGATNCGAQ